MFHDKLSGHLNLEENIVTDKFWTFSVKLTRLRDRLCIGRNVGTSCGKGSRQFVQECHWVGNLSSRDVQCQVLGFSLVVEGIVV